MNVLGGAHDLFKTIAVPWSMLLLLCDQIKCFDPLCNSLSFVPCNHRSWPRTYEMSGFHISGVFTPLDFKYLDDRYCEISHLDQWLDLPWIWWPQSVPWMASTAHRSSKHLPFFGCSFHMTLVYDREPSSYSCHYFSFMISWCAPCSKP